MSYRMDINQVAQFLGVSHKSVRRYVKAGKLKVVYLDGKGVYDESQVETLYQEKHSPVHRAIASIPEESALAGVISSDERTEIMHFVQAVQQYCGLQYLSLKLLLTIEEASTISGCSKSGLKLAVKSGKLKAVKQGGRWKLRPRDLKEYIECLFGEAGHHHS